VILGLPRAGQALYVNVLNTIDQTVTVCSHII